ncbi:TIM-barrel domain-containing protein [Streptomyces pathocidini]|uniref:TIM-barrel domain-containing protein n=1 Tax=Streptomyces pathocidini TaxID=1650571 RepID=A0ABW7US20_9ACTN|nr:TIM-barrel domain-containing protein [Streptomyces pathocidini]
MSPSIRIRRRWPLAAVAAALALPLLAPAGASASTDRQAVRQDGTIVDGKARFQVLTPTLVRLEYAEDGKFEDSPTVNAVNRSFTPPAYTTRVSGGIREISTGKLTLRYRQGSGRFTPGNTTVRLKAGGQQVTGRPQFGESTSTCVFGAVCDTEYGVLAGGARWTFRDGHATKAYGRGITDGLDRPGARTTVRVRGVPHDGTYELRLRYANARAADGQDITRTLSVETGGQRTALTLPSTGDWAVYQASEPVKVELKRGVDDITIACREGDTCPVNADAFAVQEVGGTGFPTPADPGKSANLGGWTRGLDNTPAAPYQLGDGVLSRDGWYLLDDSATALQAPGTTQPRPRAARNETAYQDGYLFGYGHDYKQGLRDLRALTGPAPLLPRWAFGVWFSRWRDYSFTEYKDLLATFEKNKVPLDALVVDTDYKGSGWWNGWTGWNPALFPDPDAFMQWAKDNKLPIALNVHPSIDGSDPAFAQAMETAQGKLPKISCYSSADCYGFDWSDPDQAKAYFDLHTPYEQQGARLWWNDYCCDAATASGEGIAPDTLINQMYADRAESQGTRGFAFSRIGASYQRLGGGYAAGPWADHRSTMHFTGDSYPNFPTLDFAARIAVAEGNIGLPYVSHDIGAFHGEGRRPDDLYARWMALGAFLPIDRVHSGGAYSLPWEYEGAAAEAGKKFLRLRGSLVPHLYSLAREASETGVPMVRGMYLNYPEYDEAYKGSQFTLGDDVLVAPVTKEGAEAEVPVWVPPGTWTDFFTGKSYTGPKTVQVKAGIDEIPVLVRDGGLVVQQDADDAAAKKPFTRATVTAGSGGRGSFELYEDEGDGQAYRAGAHATTRIEQAPGRLVIGAARGSYDGHAATRAWTVRLLDIDHRPERVSVGGARLAESTGDGPGWNYDADSRVLTVRTAPLDTGKRWVIETR